MPFLGESPPPSRAWYTATIAEFLATNGDAIVGQLVTNGGSDVLQTQLGAWRTQIDILRGQLAGLTGTICFEFMIPRMGRRIDTVLLVGPVVFAIEFKVGAEHFDGAADRTGLGLRARPEELPRGEPRPTDRPVLVATEVASAPPLSPEMDLDGVYRPLLTIAVQLRDVLDRVRSADRHARAATIDASRWLAAPYRPTPTIVEAARALYAQHSVEAIARHDAGADNLRVTSHHIEDLVEEARRSGRKHICFVTGVPGAGKTLVGLNVATRRTEADATSPSGLPVRQRTARRRSSRSSHA